MADTVQSSNSSLDDVVRFYGRDLEAPRLGQGVGQLECVRTQELLTRYLPSPPAVVLDVGGGPGVHSCWLAQQGFEMHLVDIVPLHVEQARRASAQQPAHPLASVSVGDARRLDRAESSVDAVLLLGPMYHLVERMDRVQALREARRVLRSGGVLLVAGISRLASLLEGLVHGFLDDPEFVRIVQGDLKDGRHRNPGNNPAYFTTAFFHQPEELGAEIEEAGLHHEKTLPVEGPGWLLQNFQHHWNDPGRRERLLGAIRLLEDEPSILGASAHLLAVARRPAP